MTMPDKWARWARRLAVAAFVVAIAGLAAFRQELMSFAVPLLVVAVAVVLALVAVLIGVFVVLGAPFRRAATGRRWGNVVWAFALSLVVLLPAAGTIQRGRDVPAIHDITTDTKNPPVFVAVPKRRAATDNALDIDKDVIAMQKAAYPDIATKKSRLRVRPAYFRALKRVREFGWEVVADVPPKSARGTGRIEATVKSRIFGFRDDVVIRVKPAGSGSKIDMRSASRLGRSDLGANAARITRYLSGL